jgi:hypothetical protein
MNLNLVALTKFFQGMTRPYPGRDWVIILGVVGGLSVSGIAFAAYIFLGVQTGSIVSGTTNTPRAPIPVSRDAIKTVLDTYQIRANNFASKTFPAVDLSDPRPKMK